jgi:hypothetical protein
MICFMSDNGGNYEKMGRLPSVFGGRHKTKDGLA